MVTEGVEGVFCKAVEEGVFCTSAGGVVTEEVEEAFSNPTEEFCLDLRTDLKSTTAGCCTGA